MKWGRESEWWGETLWSESQSGEGLEGEWKRKRGDG